MRELNFDVIDPRTVGMDSPEHEDGCDHNDFGFAFNNSNFSDRLLHIIIIDSTWFSSERVKTLHISSQILAARSPFFYKLFSNGMRESKQSHAILRINASEEAGLMELLKFMYSNKLTATSAPAVLDVLLAADKFGVASCMSHCSRLLRYLLITTPEFVLVYLDLPFHILMAEELQSLTVAAKQLYAVHYKDITRFEDEILRLPLVDVEALIASDNLRVTSEYAVYLFVLKWARSQYPKIEDRREIIMTRLAKFIRYPYMTYKELEEVLYNNEFDRIFAIFTVREAIAFKFYARDLNYIKDDDSHRFVKREAYKYRPAKTRVQVCSHWAWFIPNRLTWVIKGLLWVIKGLLWVIKKLSLGTAKSYPTPWYH